MTQPEMLIIMLHIDGESPWGSLWMAWSWEPFLLAGLVAAGWMYAIGVRRLWRQAGVGRGMARWQAGAFAVGLFAIFVALISPLDALSHGILSAHMVQHLLVIMVAAPLMAAAAPMLALAWVLPSPWTRSAGRWWRQHAPWRYSLVWPAIAWMLYIVAITLWHLPPLYQSAVSSGLIHLLEHGSFFGTSFLFWHVVFTASHAGGIGYPAAVLYVFTAAMYGAVLAALMTFSGVPWYGHYTAAAPLWGLSPMEDQQLAGAIMWIPGKVVHLMAVIALLLAWFRRLARRELSDVSRPAAYRDRIPGEVWFPASGRSGR